MRLPAIVSAVVASGCSFALVSGPPANHRQLPVVECTTSRVGPILDTVWTILQVSNIALAASSSEAEWDDTFGGDAPWSRNAGMGIYTGLAALGAAGMYFGFTRTSACRGAKAEWMQRGANVQWGTQPHATWPPPPPGPPPQPVAPPSTSPAP